MAGLGDALTHSVITLIVIALLVGILVGLALGAVVLGFGWLDGAQ